MRAKPVKSGDYLLGKLGTIRRIGPDTDFGFEYVEFADDTKQARRGYCTAGHLRQWGKPISEQEAHRLIPGMADQLTALERSERRHGQQVLDAALILAPDEVLIEELTRRGYDVHSRKARPSAAKPKRES